MTSGRVRMTSALSPRLCKWAISVTMWIFLNELPVWNEDLNFSNEGSDGETKKAIFFFNLPLFWYSKMLIARHYFHGDLCFLNSFLMDNSWVNLTTINDLSLSEFIQTIRLPSSALSSKSTWNGFGVNWSVWITSCQGKYSVLVP